MSRQSPWPGDGLPLSAFRDRRSDGTRESFELAFGRGFLVLAGLKLKRGTSRATLDDESTNPGKTGPTGSFLVFPIQKRPGAPFDFVSVGRAAGNDIVLGDGSVSKFHAYLRETDEGFWVQDGKSRNGTRRNDVPVPRRGEGRPVLLDAGDRVTFGSVPLTFLRADGLLELLGATKHTKW